MNLPRATTDHFYHHFSNARAQESTKRHATKSKPTATSSKKVGTRTTPRANQPNLTNRTPAAPDDGAISKRRATLFLRVSGTTHERVRVKKLLLLGLTILEFIFQPAASTGRPTERKKNGLQDGQKTINVSPSVSLTQRRHPHALPPDLTVDPLHSVHDTRVPKANFRSSLYLTIEPTTVIQPTTSRHAVQAVIRSES